MKKNVWNFLCLCILLVLVVNVHSIEAFARRQVNDLQYFLQKKTYNVGRDGQFLPKDATMFTGRDETIGLIKYGLVEDQETGDIFCEGDWIYLTDKTVKSLGGDSYIIFYDENEISPKEVKKLK